jgi:hypothetical protein
LGVGRQGFSQAVKAGGGHKTGVTGSCNMSLLRILALLNLYNEALALTTNL